jgi:hypothetical protein
VSRSPKLSQNPRSSKTTTAIPATDPAIAAEGFHRIRARIGHIANLAAVGIDVAGSLWLIFAGIERLFG